MTVKANLITILMQGISLLKHETTNFYLQANGVGSSNKMELEGAKHSFGILKGNEKLPIKTFVSDDHRGISKWMRTMQKDRTHYYDIWHQAKSTVKKDCEERFKSKQRKRL